MDSRESSLRALRELHIFAQESDDMQVPELSLNVTKATRKSLYELVSEFNKLYKLIVDQNPRARAHYNCFIESGIKKNLILNGKSSNGYFANSQLLIDTLPFEVNCGLAHFGTLSTKTNEGVSTWIKASNEASRRISSFYLLLKSVDEKYEQLRAKFDSTIKQHVEYEKICARFLFLQNFFEQPGLNVLSATAVATLCFLEFKKCKQSCLCHKLELNIKELKCVSVFAHGQFIQLLRPDISLTEAIRFNESSNESVEFSLKLLAFNESVINDLQKELFRNVMSEVEKLVPIWIQKAVPLGNVSTAPAKQSADSFSCSSTVKLDEPSPDNLTPVHQSYYALVQRELKDEFNKLDVEHCAPKTFESPLPFGFSSPSAPPMSIASADESDSSSSYETAEELPVIGALEALASAESSEEGGSDASNEESDEELDPLDAMKYKELQQIAMKNGVKGNDKGPLMLANLKEKRRTQGFLIGLDNSGGQAPQQEAAPAQANVRRQTLHPAPVTQQPKANRRQTTQPSSSRLPLQVTQPHNNLAPSSEESEAEQELVQAGGDVDTYTRQDLEAIGKANGGNAELRVFANFHGYSSKASRKTPDFIKFLIGKQRLVYKETRTINKKVRREKNNAQKRDRTNMIRYPKRKLDNGVERTGTKDKPEVKHPIWFDQFVDAIVEHPIVKTVDNQEIKSPNWNRLAPLFLDTSYKSKIEGLNPAQLRRFMELSVRVRDYINKNFEREDFFGFEGGKWNILVWVTCILGVAQSDTTTGCWNWKGGLNSDGRPMISAQGSIITVSNMMVCLNPASEPTTAEIGRDRMSFTISHLCNNKLCVNPEHLYRESLAINQSRIYCKLFCIKYCQHEPKCLPRSADGSEVPCCKHPDGICPRICDCAAA